MFRRGEESRQKKGFSLFIIFRLFLSLVMFAILGLGAYQAFTYFSGTDPTKVDPRSTVISLILSDDVLRTVKDTVGFDIPKEQIEKKVLSLGRKEGEIKIPNPEEDLPLPPEEDTSLGADKNIILRFALVADSHNDNESLQKALNQAKEEGAKFIIGLGDYSEVGTVEELQKAKAIFNLAELPYYVTAGDHDLWDARDKGFSAVERFNKVFGSPYQSFGDSDIRFVIVYNSDNYNGVDAFQMNWLEDEIRRIKSGNPKLILAFMHEPLTHPSSDRVMGKSNPILRERAGYLSNLLKENGVGGVFFGDIHFFTKYTDPRTNLPMYTVGALTKERNTQKARFALVDVFDDGSYNVLDTEVK